MNDKQCLVEDNMNLVYFIISKQFPTFIHDDDIIQAGMLGLCKAADKWDEKRGLFSTYAGKCIRNEINNEFNNRKKHKSVLSLDYEIFDNNGNKGTFGDYIIGDEDVEFIDIDSLHDQLSKQERRVFDLKQSGLTPNEIAERIGCSKNAVLKLIRTAKLRLEKTE